jgi:ABC-type dipeptide/oligopeptide/nickel transport system ATPase subunit
MRVSRQDLQSIIKRPVYIIWQDAVSCDPWQSVDDAISTGLHTIHTLGFLLSENRKQIVVAMQLDMEGEAVSMTMTIPKPWILRRLNL